MTDTPDPTESRWLTAWSSEEGERRARARIRTAFGVDPLSVWSAPGRINLVGEYTDISHGLSLSTVIPHRTFVAASRRTDATVRITTDAASTPEGAPAIWEGDLGSLEDVSGENTSLSYPASVLWAMQERGFTGGGVDLAFVSCVPPSSGLSALTSLAAATALAVNDLWGLSLPTDIHATELAEACMDAENDLAGGATAGMAQSAILRCTPGEALYLDFSERPPLASPCPLTLAEYGLGLLLIDTGARSLPAVTLVRQRMEEIRAAEAVLGVPDLRHLQAEPDGLARIEALEDPVLRKRARHVFSENDRVDLVRDELTGTAPAHERFVSVGKAMYRSHASLEMDLEVSCDELNLAVDTAFRVGALGARLVGAGGGGAAVALVRRSQAAGAAHTIDAAFQSRGLARPGFAFF